MSCKLNIIQPSQQYLSTRQRRSARHPMRLLLLSIPDVGWPEALSKVVSFARNAPVSVLKDAKESAKFQCACCCCCQDLHIFHRKKKVKCKTFLLYILSDLHYSMLWWHMLVVVVFLHVQAFLLHQTSQFTFLSTFVPPLATASYVSIFSKCSFNEFFYKQSTTHCFFFNVLLIKRMQDTLTSARFCDQACLA